MTSRLAFPLMALLAAGGCSSGDTTAPVRQERGALASAPATSAAESESSNEGSRRSGVLKATKECSQYTGLAGSFCTLTGSNLRQLPAGTRIVYEKGVAAGALETDVVLYPPGRGRSVAFGHVSLNLATSYGTGTLSGGTGKFKHLRGSFVITRSTAPRTWNWSGTYSFGGGDDED